MGNAKIVIYYIFLFAYILQSVSCTCLFYFFNFSIFFPTTNHRFTCKNGIRLFQQELNNIVEFTALISDVRHLIFNKKI